MKFDIVTIFPRMIDAGLGEGVVGRARERGLLDIAVHNLRDFTTDRHHVVDDVPFGGGPGMVMKPEPLFAAMDAIVARRGEPGAVLLLTPAGRPFSQREARRFAALGHVAVLCGRYEGIDERVRERWATDEVSIGDYVLSGGEIPALVIIDAVARLGPGVVGDDASVAHDTFARGLLDYPQYTRPAEFRGLAVPAVLMSGHHEDVERWRRREALRRTMERRPDLLERASLDAEDQALLNELLDERPGRDNEREGDS